MGATILSFGTKIYICYIQAQISWSNINIRFEEKYITDKVIYLNIWKLVWISLIILVLFTRILFSWRGYDVFAEWRFCGVEFKFPCEQKKWKGESVLLVGYFNPWTQLSIPLYNYQSATTKGRICSTGLAIQSHIFVFH